MATENQLHVRFIGIDVIPEGTPFIELKIDMHVVDTESGAIGQIVSNYGRIYRRIVELSPIPTGTLADDGVIDNLELMQLVAAAALTWVAEAYGAEINENGNVVI